MRHDFASSSKVKRLARLGLIAAAILYIVALTIPGLLLHRVSNTFAFVVGQDYHYSVALGASLRLLLDPAATLADIRVNFGLLFSLITASAADLFGVKTFGGWVKLIQVSQLLFLVAAVWSAWKLERNRWLVLAVALTAAPWMSTMNQAVVAPTSSGLRFLNLALLPGALALLKGLNGVKAAGVAGIFAALMILWNPETGVACTAALLFFVFITEFAKQFSLVRALGLTALMGATAAVFASVGVVLVLHGSGANGLFLKHLIEHVNGYNGHRLPLEPLAIICALYSSYLVIHSCFAVRAQSANTDMLARAAIAVGAVVWFAYYAHNPTFSGLYSIILLLSFTLAPFLAAQRVQIPVAVWLLIVWANVQELVTVPARFSFGQPTFQGIILPADAADYLSKHAAGLKTAPQNILYFASTPFSMALASGRTNNSAIFDLFGETWTERQFGDLMQSVEARLPVCILIESADSPLLAVSPPRGLLMQRVQKAIAPKYTLKNSEAGWDFWCRPVS